MLIKLLMTGGMDSTWTLCGLLRKRCLIQPYYLMIGNRPPAVQRAELETIERILSLLRSRERRYAISAYVEPLQIVSVEELEVSDELRDAHERLQRKCAAYDESLVDVQSTGQTSLMNRTFRVTDQTLQIAAFAEKNPGVLLSVEVGDTAEKLVTYFGNIRSLDTAVGKLYYVDQDGSDPELYKLYRNVRMPLLAISKQEIFRAYEDAGFSEVRDLVRWCYAPGAAEPCGECVTCVAYIREGLRELFSPKALLAYENKERRMGGRPAEGGHIRMRRRGEVTP